MAKQTPGIPNGTRDFSSDEMMHRNYIFDTVNKVYQKYGYLPIETPAMEKTSTLMGKYGEEGDRLLFKILNSGNFLKGVTDNELLERDRHKLAALVTKKGLRYDLTVPFARYVVKNYGTLSFPFKRSQIQPVWRADRPQKGRYREFYQCDADVIGSDALTNELEMVQMTDEVFRKLKLKVRIRINNRKLLFGIAEYMGHPDKAAEIITAIDKLEKIGEEKVYEEMKMRDVSDEGIAKLKTVLSAAGGSEKPLKELETILEGTDTGKLGMQEVKQLFGYIDAFEFSNRIVLDITLARGLDYYTGTIFETVSEEVPMGSICGGGRYDNLTGIFGLDNMSGVGISFGADRIYDVLESLQRFPVKKYPKVQVLFVNFGEKEEQYCLQMVNHLRNNEISAELYPDAAKMKKQMKYADSNAIPFVVLAGESEIKAEKYTLKNMQTGEQQLMSADELRDAVRKTL
jgi:histidyl-tRNA synthetase